MRFGFNSSTSAQHNRIKPEQLRAFDAFTALPADDLVMLAQFFEVEKLRPGSFLFDVGADDTRDYLLLQGQVDLVASDGRRTEIPASSSRARQPLARLRPRKFAAEVVMPSVLLSIDHQQLESLMQQIEVDEIRVFNMEDTKLSQYPFYLNMTADLSARRLRWHYPEDVGTGLKQRAQQTPDSALVALLMSDPLLAGRAIRCAQLTDPTINGQGAVAEVLTALTPDTLRQLIHAQPVGSFTHPTIEQAWHAHWNRALELASMCRELSIQTQIGQPEDIEIRVMWAELGSLVLLEYLDHEPAIAQDPAAIRASLMACSREASQMIIREWKLGELTEKIAASHPDHPPQQDMADEVDLVIFAKMHRKLMGHFGVPSDWRSHASVERIATGIELTPQLSLQMLDSARARAAGLSRPWSQAAS